MLVTALVINTLLMFLDGFAAYVASRRLEDQGRRVRAAAEYTGSLRRELLARGETRCSLLFPDRPELAGRRLHKTARGYAVLSPEGTWVPVAGA